MRRTLATLAAVAAGGIMLATPAWAYPGQGHDDPCQDAGSNCGNSKPTVTITTTAPTTVYSTLPGTTVYVPTTAVSTASETVTLTEQVTATVTDSTTVVETETATETAEVTVTERETETATVTHEVTATEQVTHEVTETAYATATLTGPPVTLTERATVTERETLRETVTGTATVTQHQLVAKSFGYVVEDGSSRLVTSGESTGPVIDGPATTDAALAHTGFDSALWSAAGALALTGGGLLIAASRRRGEHQ